MHFVKTLTCSIALVCILFSLSACGEDEKVPESRLTVLVLDDGFDLSLDAFQGKVVAAKTITCQQGSGDAPPAPTTFEERKAAVLALYKTRDERCALEDGIGHKARPLEGIEGKREAWNHVIRTQAHPNTRFGLKEYQDITRRLDEALDEGNFHGTATAGVIARDNDRVRLVLVEDEIPSGEDADATFQCLSQQAVDGYIELMEDKDVMAAAIARPVSQLGEQLVALQKEFGVQVANESFGPLPREAIERLQAENGCDFVDLGRAFEMDAEISRAWINAHPGPPILIVKSAGNSGSQVDGPADFPPCGQPLDRIFVGSYDHMMERTSFTNHGACVDAFAPGMHVVAPFNGGWLVPLSGTSFSAPLVVRWLSLNRKANERLTQTKTQLLSKRDEQRRLPSAMFPRELTYDPLGEDSSMALRVSGDDSPAPLAVRPAVRLHLPEGSTLDQLLRGCVPATKIGP